MKKRILSAVLSLALLLALMPTVAYAASDEAISSADALYNMGMFNGTGTDANGNPIFDLDRAPTRNEAVTMLVRLLAKEIEAKAKEWNTPFTDVADWAKPYVGYAYTNKLTSGTSGTTYGGSGTVTASQYITFVLRALGYNSGTDFQWDKAWELSDKIGLTSGQYNASTTNFTRGDVAIISYNALFTNLKGSKTTLFEKIVADAENPVEHTHDWQTRKVEEVGHYESGTRQVLVKLCDCGFKVSYDQPNANAIWTSHAIDCDNRSIYWYEDVPAGESKYVIDTPAHYETYCTICGATK